MTRLDPENDISPLAPTILVVEDEVLIRALVADSLREEGFRVVEAATADEALTYLLAGANVDAVFSDIDMPGSINGLELARYILEHHPQMKTILTSGGTNEQEGATLAPFIKKPFRLANVVRIIRAATGYVDE